MLPALTIDARRDALVARRAAVRGAEATPVESGITGFLAGVLIFGVVVWVFIFDTPR